MDPILEIENVSKRFESLTAVDDVSLNVYPGEIFALLGPNGAGKTTLIGCIGGLIQNFEGSIRVIGQEVRKDYALTRQLVGLVPQELNFDGFFSARHTLFYQGGFFGVRHSRERMKELFRIFSLTEKANSNTRWLSGGMKRRLMICKALMHEPPLLFLDEPTAGVDVELREELWNYVRSLRENGTTILLTTHYLEEAEELADRIGIINQGKLVVVERRDDLLQQYGERWIQLRFDKPLPEALVKKWSSLGLTYRDEQTVLWRYREGQGEAHGPELARILMRDSETFELSVSSVEGGRSKLEDIFRSIVNDQNRKMSPA